MGRASKGAARVAQTTSLAAALALAAGCLPRAQVRDGGASNADVDASRDASDDVFEGGPLDVADVGAMPDAGDSDAAPFDALDALPGDAPTDGPGPEADVIPVGVDVTGTLSVRLVSVPRCVPAFAAVEFRVELLGGREGRSVRLSTEFGPGSGVVPATRVTSFTSDTEPTVVSFFVRANGDGIERRDVAGSIVAEAALDSGRASFTVNVGNCPSTPDTSFRRSDSDAPGERGIVTIPRMMGVVDGPRYAWITALGFEPGGTRVLVSGVGMNGGPDWYAISEINNPQLLFARFSHDGAPDTTLVDAVQPGIVTRDLTTGGKEMYWDLLPLEGGGALIAGEVYAPTPDGLMSDQSVVRLRPSGEVDVQLPAGGYGTRNSAGLRTGVAVLPPMNPMVGAEPAYDGNDSALTLLRRGDGVLVGGTRQTGNLVAFGTHAGTLSELSAEGDRALPPVVINPPQMTSVPRGAAVRAILEGAGRVLYVAGDLDASNDARQASRGYVTRLVPSSTNPSGYDIDLAFVGDTTSRFGGARPDGLLVFQTPPLTPGGHTGASTSVQAMFFDTSLPEGPAIVMVGYLKADLQATLIPWVARIDALTGAARPWSGRRTHTFFYRCGYPDSVGPADSSTVGAFRVAIPRPGGGFYAAGSCSNDRTAGSPERSVVRELGSSLLVVAFGADGLPVASFGNGGTDWSGALHIPVGDVLALPTSATRYDQAFDIALDDARRLYIAGTAQNASAAYGFVLRLLPEAL